MIETDDRVDLARMLKPSCLWPPWQEWQNIMPWEYAILRVARWRLKYHKAGSYMIKSKLTCSVGSILRLSLQRKLYHSGTLSPVFPIKIQYWDMFLKDVESTVLAIPYPPIPNGQVAGAFQVSWTQMKAIWIPHWIQFVFWRAFSCLDYESVLVSCAPDDVWIWDIDWATQKLEVWLQWVYSGIIITANTVWQKEGWQGPYASIERSIIRALAA
jgi:hypothetical protein